MSRELLDSNIYYLGKIPNNWNSKKYKYFSDLRMGETILASSTVSEGIPIYSATKEDKIFGYVKEANVKLKKGELVIPARGNSIGYVSIVKEKEATCTQTTICSYNIHDINNKFLYYSILGLNNEWFKFDGSAIPQITVEQVKNCILALPPEDEQELIVKYLDNRVSLIDETIENNKKEIELLDEYKKNIFSDVIKEYNFKNYKLKYLTNKKLQYGANSSGVVYRDDLPRYVRITDILNNTLKEQDKLSLQEDEAKDFILKDGDILFARSGGTVGKSFMYENKFGRCAFAGYLIRASFNNKELAQYVYNFTNSVLYEKWKNSIFIQSTIQNIGADKYSNMLIPIPIDFDNVVRVNNKINKIIIKLDKVIEYRNQIIEKLEEYKKSLIYEAVTGKIEV